MSVSSTAPACAAPASPASIETVLKWCADNERQLVQAVAEGLTRHTSTTQFETRPRQLQSDDFNTLVVELCERFPVEVPA